MIASGIWESCPSAKPNAAVSAPLKTFIIYARADEENADRERREAADRAAFAAASAARDFEAYLKNHTLHTPEARQCLAPAESCLILIRNPAQSGLKRPIPITSANTPAAVTSAPAPGPRITSGRSR